LAEDSVSCHEQGNELYYWLIGPEDEGTAFLQNIRQHPSNDSVTS